MPLSAKGKKSSQREPLVGERSRGTIRPELHPLRVSASQHRSRRGEDPWTSHYKRSRPGKGVAEQISPIPGNPGVTHLIFTAMQRRPAARDSSPNAPACRSRRGEAPEGSSLFSPHVEARSAEDCGRGCQERYTTPPGCRTYKGVRQPVRHPCGVAITCDTRSTGLRCYAPRPRG